MIIRKMGKSRLHRKESLRRVRRASQRGKRGIAIYQSHGETSAFLLDSPLSTLYLHTLQ